MNYQEALEYIHGVNWTFCKPGLERISELCRGLGNPEKKLKFVHVAGTNGKGSFCSMLESVLRAAGYKTGLYTSPFVKVFGERMRVMGENISDGVLADITARVRPVADAMADKPTEFELITAIAFEYFYESGCDVVVLEAGMGGRLDSTNVIESPLLSVITGIALDHTDYLGNTVEKIAHEKAGIIKPGYPVFYGGEDDTARGVIKKRAAELNSSYYDVDYGNIANSSFSLLGTTFDYKGHKNVKINLLGEYQSRNATAVIRATEILREGGLNISESALYQGLEAARWPARFEIIRHDPMVIFDGAHNPQGISSAAQSIKRYFGNRRVLILSGVLRDKDYEFIAGKLAEVAKSAFTITPDSPRALAAEDYARTLISHGVPATPYPSIKEALCAAIKAAKESGDALICLGSLYTYCDVTDSLDKIV
ncbi:MAG: bifunctional folylpolyglutamate synthase/dihydrofolate synthase [Clostridia bacterium]|nr:bifunctional folylpolyglutamate synthase/dihydrofolate synthase [Clostridia bacterium]